MVLDRADPRVFRTYVAVVLDKGCTGFRFLALALHTVRYHVGFIHVKDEKKKKDLWEVGSKSDVKLDNSDLFFYSH